MKLTRTVDEIHRYYKKQLSGLLQFGNPEQIKVIKQWERALSDFEEEEQRKNDPTLPKRKYVVRFSYRTDDRETVEASSAAEAREILEDDYCDYDDLEIESVEPE